MWLYRFIDIETRNDAPTLSSFMKYNNDIIKPFYEQVFLQMDLRETSNMRFLKFFNYLFLMAFMVNVFSFSELRSLFFTCHQRNVCQESCYTLHFPNTTYCYSTNKYHLSIRGNTYYKLYVFPYSTNQIFMNCRNYVEINDQIGDVLEEDRQKRIHTCFNLLKNGFDNIINDNRPTENCTKMDMLCVDPLDTCENDKYLGEFVLYTTESGTKISLSLMVASLAIIVAIPIQYFYELLSLYRIRISIKERETTWENIIFITLNLFHFGLPTFLILAILRMVIILCSFGGVNVYLYTLVTAIIIDQIKNIIFLIVIWYIIIRRCGYLVTKDQEVIDPRKGRRLEVSFITLAREIIQKKIESEWYILISNIIFGIYVFFVLVGVSIQFLDLDDILQKIGLGFLIFFIFESSMQIIVIGADFFMDFWKDFDLAIIIILLVLTVNSPTNSFIPTLQLLWVILISIYRYAGNPLKIRFCMADLPPPEALNKVIDDLGKNIIFDEKIKKEVKYISNIINKELYNQMRIEEDQIKTNIYFKEWVNLCSEKSIDPRTWFPKELDEETKTNKDDEENEGKQGNEASEEGIRQYVALSNKEWNYANKATEDLKIWSFDCHSLVDILKEKTTVFLAFKIFSHYELFKKYSIPYNNFISFIKLISETYPHNSSYTNYILVNDLMRTIHFLISNGLNKYLKDSHIISLFFACLFYCAGHTGLTNYHLVKRNHNLAIRYNNKCVNENHCLATGFKFFYDPNIEILTNLTEKQYWEIRTNIINIILDSALSNHYNLISEFEKYTKNESFPDPEIDQHLRVLMSMAFYTALHSTPAKPETSYIKWFYARIEELYEEGDLEKKVGIKRTFFFDRSVSNPFDMEKGYLEVIAEPVLTTWINFQRNLKTELLDNNLKKNKNFLSAKKEEALDKIKPSDLESAFRQYEEREQQFFSSYKLIPENSFDLGLTSKNQL